MLYSTADINRLKAARSLLNNDLKQEFQHCTYNRDARTFTSDKGNVIVILPNEETNGVTYMTASEYRRLCKALATLPKGLQFHATEFMKCDYAANTPSVTSVWVATKTSNPIMYRGFTANAKGDYYESAYYFTGKHGVQSHEEINTAFYVYEDDTWVPRTLATKADLANVHVDPVPTM